MAGTLIPASAAAASRPIRRRFRRACVRLPNAPSPALASASDLQSQGACKESQRSDVEAPGFEGGHGITMKPDLDRKFSVAVPSALSGYLQECPRLWTQTNRGVD